MQNLNIILKVEVESIQIEMNPIQLAKYNGNYAYPSIKAVPTETGYIVTAEKNETCQLLGYLKHYEPELYKEAYDKAVKQLIMELIEQ